MKNSEIKFRCTQEFKDKATLVAEKNGRTLSNFITYVVEKELEKYNEDARGN